MSYCMHCGKELQPGNRFCIHCGKSSEQAAAPAVKSPGRNIGRVSAIVVLVGFLLPWVSCAGFQGTESISGFGLAGHGEVSGLWLIPLSMGLALAALMNLIPAFAAGAKAAKVAIGCGALCVVVLLYYYARFTGAGESDPLGMGSAMRQAFHIEIGAILSLLGSVGVALGGFLELKPH